VATTRIKKTTIKDVTEAVGVSMAIVDRVINNRAKVNPDTIQQVIKNYRRIAFSATARLPSEPLRMLRLEFIMESGRPFIDSIRTVVERIPSYLQFNISLHIYQTPLPLNLQEFTARRVAAIGQDTKSKVAVAINVLLHHHQRNTTSPTYSPAAPLVFLKRNIGSLISYGLPVFHDELNVQ
jgi:hypothetical protein